MDERDESEEIMSKSSQIFAPDLHSMMAGALAASAGQNLKICLGSSSGKTQRPTSKLKRAGDIRLSEAIYSPVVAKIGSNKSPQNSAPEVMAEALAASAGQNLTKRPLSKLKRAGDIRLSAASSPVVAKIGSNNSPQNSAPEVMAEA